MTKSNHPHVDEMLADGTITQEDLDQIDAEVTGPVLTEEQLLAVDRIHSEPISIITGPAGSGKTQCLRQALADAPKNIAILLCAPTAKAAKRMTELTDFPASTIHRAIGAQGPGEPDKINKENPLPYDLIVVDESSMIDDDLMSRLLLAVPPSSRIVFIGDVNQIPPVSAGHPFSDLILSKKIPTTYLTRNFRAEAGSWVAEHAIGIVSGHLSRKPAPSFKFILTENPDEINLRISAILRKAGRKDIQIISPMYAGPGGIDELNRSAQNILNQSDMHARSMEVMAGEAREGDPVRATRNDYNLDTFNGDVGVVAEVHGKHTDISFDGFIRELPNDYVKTMRLAYAMSVHSVQGSEYPWIIVVCHSQHGHMWNRQLLYTAVTRAQEGVIMVGDHTGVAQALSTNGHERFTALGQLMEAQ